VGSADLVEDLAVAREASFSRSELESWNLFLASELGIHKGSEIYESLSLHGLSTDPSATRDTILRSSQLSEGLRNAVKNAKLPAQIPSNISVLLYDAFPEYLSYSDSRYAALMVQGDATALQRPTIGIVGTRSATSYGKNCARKFASDFAKAGVTVVSGGAAGIDTAAHEGAISAGGKTAVVKPSGIDISYPRMNEGLFQRASENGCLVSQFAFGTSPRPESFIQRNHLIAALSQAVVIIEAPPKSGAIHTAVFAAEMGREVYVVPGPIDQRNFIGSHSLIKDGCTFVDHPDQVLLGIGITPGTTPQVSSFEGTAAQIMEVLTAEAMSVEELVEATGLDSSEILSELTILELDGNVVRENGRYSRPL